MTPCEAYRAFAAAHPGLRGLRPPTACPGVEAGTGTPVPTPTPATPWGPALWREAEQTALRGGLTAAWMEGYTARLPSGSCGCRGHWQALLVQAPPPYGAPAAEQLAWVVARHNDVNRRLGKPELPLAEGVAAAQKRNQPGLV